MKNTAGAGLGHIGQNMEKAGHLSGESLIPVGDGKLLLLGWMARVGQEAGLEGKAE